MGQGAWLERTSGIILPKALQQPTIFFFRVFSRLWPRNTTFIATKKHKIHKKRVERRASSVERREFSLKRSHPLPVTRHLPRFLQSFLRLFAAIIFPPPATRNFPLHAGVAQRVGGFHFILPPSNFLLFLCHPLSAQKIFLKNTAWALSTARCWI